MIVTLRMEGGWSRRVVLAAVPVAGDLIDVEGLGVCWVYRRTHRLPAEGEATLDVWIELTESEQ